jgi:hypothetical protein
LHNVHEKMPTIFQTRWVMSYLAGPLTRDQIRALCADRPAAQAPAPAPASTPAAAPAQRPLAPPGLQEYFLAPARIPARGEQLVYWPRLLGAAEVRYGNARLNVDVQTGHLLAAELSGEAPDWDNADTPAAAVSQLDTQPRDGAGFTDCPAALLDPGNIRRWESDLKRWLRDEKPLTVLRSPAMKVNSTPGESEGDFRARLQVLGNEQRDQNVAKLKKKYEPKFQRVQEQRMRAEQAIQREAEQAQQHKFDTAISFGTAILGAVLGRKTVSATSANRVGTAVRKAGRARQQSQDVDRAREKLLAVEQKIQSLEARFQAEVEDLEDAYDAQMEQLECRQVRPRATDIHISRMGLGWLPYIQGGDGRLSAAWDPHG